VPYGYRLAADESGLEVVEDEARVVREIIERVAAGSTLYSESKRLNDEGVPSPGRRFKSNARKHSLAWSPSTVAFIVHQSAYGYGKHEVKITEAGGESVISRNVPTIVKREIQERAQSTLAENKRYPNRKNDRKYLLRGLIRCGTCGRPCCGRPVTKVKGGKRYFYYICTATRPEFAAKTTPHSTPRVSAPWLEELVWQDIKQFIENPGETLERVRSLTPPTKPVSFRRVTPISRSGWPQSRPRRSATSVSTPKGTSPKRSLRRICSTSSTRFRTCGS
jgi:site-specific DNA recombinase